MEASSSPRAGEQSLWKRKEGCLVDTGSSGQELDTRHFDHERAQ